MGQGSWLTWLEGPSCVHVDIGGELFPHDVLRLCGDRENIIYLTHLDWDHISFAKRFYQQAPSTCVVPNFQSQKGKAKVFLSRLPRCPPLKTLRVQSLYQPKRFINANQASTFYSVNNKVLITGDAPQSEERNWVRINPSIMDILILGHHGSHTSTSKELLQRVRPKLSIASARKEKFGHPHKKTRELLKQFKVPLLTTQSWGHIYLDL